MTSVKHVIRPQRVVAASVLIMLVHLAASFTNIPVVIQLVSSSIACVYIGCFLAFRVEKKAEEHGTRAQPLESQESMTSKDALQFPIYGSLVLGGIYVLYKLIDKDILSLIFTAHFMFVGLFCVASMIEIPFSAIFGSRFEDKLIVKKNININLPLLHKQFEFSLNQQEAVCIAIAIIPTIIYILTRHWISNNIFGVAFSVMGINNLILPNFKVGYILMWGLFFYDIFWVYGTDVMVTVAKSFDAPIKLLFPYDWETGKKSMLGLGDIVIPGVFVALALKYDIDHRLKSAGKNIHAVETPYFNFCFGGYVVGILTTFAVMIIFDHPQPALLFLVPTCTISVFIRALIDGKVKELFAYDETEHKKIYQPEDSSEKTATGESAAAETKPLKSE